LSSEKTTKTKRLENGSMSPWLLLPKATTTPGKPSEGYGNFSDADERLRKL